MTTATDVKTRASLALHHILTNLNAWKEDIAAWDMETWIVFHNLIILFSDRKNASNENWALKVLAYTGGIRSTLEKKQQSGIELACNPDLVLHRYIELAGYFHDADKNNADEGIIRIYRRFREFRNKLILKEDDAFAYLLTETNLEVDTPYTEPDIHEEYRIVLSDMTSRMNSYGKEVKNLQFEVSKKVEGTDVQNSLFEYFKNKGLKISESAACCGAIYDADNNHIWSTSVTVEDGYQNSVAVISLMK